MSEQKQSGFMQKLDLWVEDAIFRLPIEQQVKKAIREKILESYRNGQKAGPRVFKQRQEGGR